jgi:2-C-methyl-D-erythritol 4-phosphate cytidylyltransferase
VPAADIELARARLASDGVRVVEGGATRWETTARLVEAATTEWVMLHDTVHPLVSPRLVADLLVAAQATGAAAACQSIEQFVWDAANGVILEPRRTMLIQSPHVLRRDVLRAAVELVLGDPSPVGREANFLQALTALGHPWTLVVGGARNIKVTHPEDLDLVRAIVAGAGAPPAGGEAA